MTTNIEWTDETWNPVSGCSKVSAGCKHCYAERIWKRLSAPNMPYHGREFTDVMCHPDRLDKPLKWRKPRKVFVNSMSDLFHEDVPYEFIDKIFAVMALVSFHGRDEFHTMQILTKRPERMRHYITMKNTPQRVYKAAQRLTYTSIGVDTEDERAGLSNAMRKNNFWPLPNVWLGVSVEDQETANERIPLLLKTPSAIRWVSAEPLLGPINIKRHLYDHTENERGICIPSCGERRSRNNDGRHNMEDPETRVGSMEKKGCQPIMQESSSRTRPGRLPAGSDNAEQCEDLRHSPSSSLDTFQRPDTRGIDNQSQKRKKEEEYPVEPRVSNIFGATDSRPACPQSGANRSERREERYGEINYSASKNNQDATCKERVPAGNSEGLRNKFSSGIKNCSVRTLGKISWCIVGGESGPKARPMIIGWAKDIVSQCKSAGVPVFVKQLGSNPTNREGDRCPSILHKKGAKVSEWPTELQIQEYPCPGT